MKHSPITTDAEMVSVVSHKGDVWHVRILLPSFEETDNEEMVNRLREAKHLIADEFAVPYHQLELGEVLGKKRLSEGIEALVSISKVKSGKGKPVVKLKPGVSPQGSLFPDITAELDFYYIDEFDHPIDMQRLKDLIAKSGIAFDRCDFDAIKRALEKVRESQSEIIGLPIARGEFPEEGVDAQLEYTFYAQRVEGMNPCEYAEGRKVKEGDILCQKIPATQGKKPGIDVRGGEIPPTKGLDFDLIAGPGTQLSTDGNTLTAQIDGMATLKRSNRRVYTLTGEKIFPSQIEVIVKPIVRLNAEVITDVILDESVEIEGKLKAGSSIMTRGDVFLKDGVEEGANVIAGSSVVVGGKVHKGTISSDDSVITGSDIKDSVITAGKDVEVQGVLENSDVTGDRVTARGASGSRITARQGVTLDFAKNDAAGNRTIIKTGHSDYYSEKLKIAEKELDDLKTNLKNISSVFGVALIKELKSDNIQLVLIQHLRNLRQAGKGRPDNSKVQSMKKLLQAVIPLKEMIADKTIEIQKLRQKAAVEEDERPVVVIREPLTDAVEIVDNGAKKKYQPS